MVFSYRAFYLRVVATRLTILNNNNNNNYEIIACLHQRWCSASVFFFFASRNFDSRQPHQRKAITAI
jgi:hypothetical protein